jgi:addiction module RelB/DinJ family antitoxin
MANVILNVKVDEQTKKKAQKIAEELGFSLSDVMRGYLHEFVRKKKVEFDLGEEPSEYLKKRIRQAEKDWEAGKVSPAFKSAKEAIKWLHEEHDL